MRYEIQVHGPKAVGARCSQLDPELDAHFVTKYIKKRCMGGNEPQTTRRDCGSLRGYETLPGPLLSR
eukprot:scaffold243994_cov20-Prasinocladus_malaysianus.AAC.1